MAASSMWLIAADAVWTVQLVLFVNQRSSSGYDAIRTNSRLTHRSFWLGLAPSTSSKSKFLASIMVSTLLWLVVCFAVHPILEMSTTNFLPSAIAALAPSPLFWSFLLNSSMTFCHHPESVGLLLLSNHVNQENDTKL